MAFATRQKTSLDRADIAFNAKRSAMAMKMLQQTAASDAASYTKACFLAWNKAHVDLVVRIFTFSPFVIFVNSIFGRSMALFWPPLS